MSKLNIVVDAHIHSKDGGLGRATILEKTGDNEYIAKYGGVKCTAIFNPFVNRYYIDDKYGVIKDTPKRNESCR